MRFLVAGSSGFLGSNLVAALNDAGHDVTRVVRRTPTARDEIGWDPYDGLLDQSVVDKTDVVINLAGSPTVGNPHSAVWANQLRNSRVTTTRILSEAVARTHRSGMGQPALLAGSGVGYYGDHGVEEVDETGSSNGGTFMTSVVRDWEAATQAAKRAGARVCTIRTAPVIDRASAPLRQMLPVFKAGLGARLGGGRQYFPIISLRDWVAATLHLSDSDISGAVNVCCPVTPTNAEFTEALASAVGRRARFAIPGRLIAAGAGPVSGELLGSVRARPAALEKDGFGFADYDARDVVAAALATPVGIG